MRRGWIIPGLLVALILFSARTCDDGSENQLIREEEALLEEMDHVRNLFGAEYLSEGRRFAFEEKAKQKLLDYAEYLRIATTDTLDVTFRTLADSMISGLFMPGCIPGISKQENVVLILDSISVPDPLHRSGPYEYLGRLSFVQRSRNLSGIEPFSSKQEHKMVEIFAVRQAIPYGTDTLIIWKVLLGEIH
ncbi:MAG: hypothetical protein HQ542_00755 [Bacteroidia bacterium]|nr:hypothetical protein [Bacteroidia bacterium]